MFGVEAKRGENPSDEEDSEGCASGSGTGQERRREAATSWHFWNDQEAGRQEIRRDQGAVSSGETTFRRSGLPGIKRFHLSEQTSAESFRVEKASREYMSNVYIGIMICFCIQRRTGSSHRPCLIRRTGPVSSGVTRNSGAPAQKNYPRRALHPIAKGQWASRSAPLPPSAFDVVAHQAG